jgi:hypothetical protein
MSLRKRTCSFCETMTGYLSVLLDFAIKSRKLKICRMLSKDRSDFIFTLTDEERDVLEYIARVEKSVTKKRAASSNDDQFYNLQEKTLSS